MPFPANNANGIRLGENIMKLKHKLPLVNALVIVLGFGIIWNLSFRTAMNFFVESHANSFQKDVMLETERVEHLIETGVSQLRVMKNYLEILAMDWSRAEELLLTVADNSKFKVIGILLPDGTYSIAGENQGVKLPDIEIFNNFDLVSLMETRVHYMANNQIFIAEPIVKNGEIVGALFGSIAFNEINDVLKRGKNSGNYYFVSLEENGRLMEEEFSRRFEGSLLEEIFSKLASGSQGIIISEENDKDSYIFYQQFSKENWFIMNIISADEFLSPLTKLTTRFYLIFILGLIFLLITTSRIIKKYIGAIEELINSVKRVEAGDYSVRVHSKRKDELGKLADHLNTMLEAISTRDSELSSLNRKLTNSIERLNISNGRLEKAYSEIARNYNQQRVINQLSEKLSSIRGMEELLREILIYTQDIVGAGRSIVFLLDREERAFRVKSYQNYSEDEIVKLYIDEADPVYNWVLKNKESVCFKNIHQEGFKVRLESDYDYDMLLYMPILADEGNVIGFINYFSKELDMGFSAIIKQMSKMISITIQNEGLLNEVKETYFSIIVSLVKAMDLKDNYTKGHSERVMNYSMRLGKALGLEGYELETLKYGSILHDIGKLGIPDSILLKKEFLTEDEYNLIKEHPNNGVSFVENLRFLHPALGIIKSHHERLDGKGYPEGLKGEEINLLTRIVSIADAYDAMTSDRAYRRRLAKQEAFIELRSNCGSQFDPELVEKFIALEL